MTSENKETKWFSKHTDTLFVLGAIGICFWTLNNRLFNIDQRLNHLENRLTTIETVLILQKIMPPDLCVQDKEDQK